MTKNSSTIEKNKISEEYIFATSAYPNPENRIIDSEEKLASIKGEERSIPFAEIATYFSCYLSAKVDHAKLTVREALLRIAFEVFLFLLGLGALLIGAAFLMYGIANGLGKILGGEIWLGCLLTGAFFFLTVGLALHFMLVLRKKRALQKKIKEYEQELAIQYQNFGYNVVSEK